MKLNTYLICLISLLIAAFSVQNSQALIINEIMSANVSTMADNDGEFHDWFELYNNQETSLNLEGYAISDDLNNPYKWIFPDITLQPGQHLLVFASSKNVRELENQWTAIIDSAYTWKYSPGNPSLPATWTTLGFDDSNWNTGQSGIGYGDNDDNTIIANTLSLYLRHTFSITNLANINSALFHIDYDDGYVAYLNGIEISRENLEISDGIPSWDTFAEEEGEARLYRSEPLPFTDVNPLLLFEGDNVLAIQVHNHSDSSDDLSALPFLSLKFNDEDESIIEVNSNLILPPPELHTNFRLSSEGEVLILSSSNGETIDFIEFGHIPADVSYGRSQNIEEWVYFSEPTPGQNNSENGSAEFAEDVDFSIEGGIYSGLLSLELNVNSDNAVIHYTTDGSLPDESSPVYNDAILLDENKVIRARSYEFGFMPGKTITHSFLIDISHTLPVISLSTSPDNLFDSQHGIYINQNCHQDWERPVHIEFFEIDGNTAFNLDAGIKIYGGVTRDLPQKSLAIFFRSMYGQGSVDYKIFPDLDVEIFTSFILRNSGNDFWHTHFRDALMTGLVKNTGLDLSAYRPAVVYINGEYWGLHNIREKLNEEFLATHHYVDPDKLDILEGFHAETVIEGSSDHYIAMKRFISRYPMSDNANYEIVKTMMDIENFIKYQVVENFICNTDWPSNNVKMWRPQTPVGRWRWLLYDTDFGFGREENYDFNMMEFCTDQQSQSYPNPGWSTLIFRRLLENESFCDDFINIYCDYLNSSFLTQKMEEQITEKMNAISSEIEDYHQRWYQGDYQEWLDKVDVLFEFARYRPDYAEAHLRSFFNLSAQKKLTVNQNSMFAGAIEVNSLILNSSIESWTGNYYPDIKITLTANPAPGTKFLHWQGLDDNSSERTVSFFLNDDKTVSPVFVPSDNEEESIIINEICYNPAENFDCGDWIELYNRSDAAINLGNWYLCDSELNHVFYLPENTIIEENGFLVLARELRKFKQFFPEAENVTGDFEFGFSGNGEEIRILSPSNKLVDLVKYSDSSPWPEAADGKGPTLELIYYEFDNSKPDSWSASSRNGTPGKVNSVYKAPGAKNKLIAYDYALSNAWPNPFNPSTTIRFSIPSSQIVNLSIYNIYGQLVRTLVNEQIEPGSHRVNFDATNLSSGTYFYRIKAGNYTALKKCILLK